MQHAASFLKCVAPRSCHGLRIYCLDFEFSRQRAKHGAATRRPSNIIFLCVISRRVSALAEFSSLIFVKSSMKKTVAKHRNRLLKKNPARAPRKSWLKAYSHVAYVVSIFNLFLFPARANVQAAPPIAAKACVCALPSGLLPSSGPVYCSRLPYPPEMRSSTAEPRAAGKCAGRVRCAPELPAAMSAPGSACGLP